MHVTIQFEIDANDFFLSDITYVNSMESAIANFNILK